MPLPKSGQSRALEEQGGRGQSFTWPVRSISNSFICVAVHRVPRFHPLVISSEPREQPPRQAGYSRVWALPQRTPRVTELKGLPKKPGPARDGLQIGNPRAGL